MLLFKNQNMKVFTTLSDKKKRSAMSILRPTLCALLLVFSSLLLFQCGDEAEDLFKEIEGALEDLAPSFGDKTIADQTYTQNAEITKLTLPEATGGEAPLTYSLSPALPTGLSFNATTREITGTPTVRAAKEYTYTATGANDISVELTFMITVTAVPSITLGSGSRSLFVGASSTSTTITITSNVAWKATETEDWITSVTPATGVADPFAPTLTIAYEANAATAARMGTITFTETNTDGTALTGRTAATTTLTVTQSAAASITADKTTVTFPVAGGNYEVMITSTGGDWDVSENIAWLQATKVANTLLKVTCEENTGAERSGKVTATIEEESVEITVTQSADTAPSFGDKTIADQTYTQNAEIPTLSLPEATGGEVPLTYSLSPDLPTGLSFDATTREITGTPTVAAAETEYTYTATDEDYDAVTLVFDITVTVEPE